MARERDPTVPIRKKASKFPAVAEGTSCTQSSFKAGKGSFLFVGPGPKGRGYKAMFKLERSMPQAKKLAEKQPDRFEVGSGAWVTTRFSAEEPLPKTIWEKWLKESYDLTCGPGTKSKKKATKKKVAKKKIPGKRNA